VATTGRRSAVITVTHAPYGGGLARAAIDTALAGAAFEQPVSVLFMGAGVLNLIPDQDARAVGSRNVQRLLASLPMYDIETVYVDARAVARHGIDEQQLSPRCCLLEPVELRALLLAGNHLLGF
jgi:tRNA 2-thiouridine synthesizing protein C